ncbi:GHMP family kinase ATP-binding protein [Methylorubrum extorquens]|uniref:GHMP family kinase ATP-binding protein n=1 Tax=Methylorubrum extorquens TaxID=408 RepID=UPI0020A13245|nr:hypothetical protein [Methylorubrum extorquens]MCP1538098.1 D-glycero-alpha-D-manno-heptose-7-phosphate kinase [Methylorubrum extorquens]
MSEKKIRCRAPLRLGIAGGGTDLSPFCDLHGGAILNCTIDRYAYAFITKRPDGVLQFVARDLNCLEQHRTGNILDTSEGLRFHRAVYNYFLTNSVLDPNLGLTVTTSVDCPPGSGLGSSSALVVAICEAFRFLCNTPLGLYDLAHLAFELERCQLNLAGGKQDQYSAAFGGVNFIEFLPQDRVIVNPLRITPAILNELEASLIVCWTGVSRDSEHIINEQVEQMKSENTAALDALFALKVSALDMKQALLSGNLPLVGEILNRSWQSKKGTAHSVSNALIDRLFDVGLAAGARAGKVSGAGGGGFMMFLVDPEDRYKVIRALNEAGGQANPIHLTARGVEVWQQP